MRDGEYESDPLFHTVGFFRVRQDLVDPVAAPADTDEPVRHTGPAGEPDEPIGHTSKGDVSVELDPDEPIVHVTITRPAPDAPSNG